MSTEGEPYYIRDIESGELVGVSKKQYDAYQNAIQLFRPKIEGVKGSIQIFGTSGENNNDDFKELWTPLNKKR